MKKEIAIAALFMLGACNMGWPKNDESFRHGTASDQARISLDIEGAAIEAVDKDGRKRPYAIKIYEADFGVSDYDLYIDHGLNITVDDIIYVHGSIRNYNQTHPPSDQDGTGPDGISREWISWPSFGTNNYTPAVVSACSKYLHMRRVISGAPSIATTGRFVIAYFTD
ncbi:hypothetical protein GWN42_31345 [candidate division KSB1 bacterium]|nr:hypothetical protein [Phycisphaerae bacterium]NIQ92555.1 hypothetical protein [Deltaproteobacteria bacterium]NIV97165.1 hypothetical protein [candidate division KSB1 bacterium]